jgi:protein TonB
MHLASLPSPSDPDHATARRRAVSFLITIAVHLLLLLMLLRLAPPFAKMSNSGGGRLITVSVAPEQQETTRSPAKARHVTSAPAPAPSVPPPKIQLPPVAAPWVLTPGLERFDVRHVPPSPSPQQQQPSDASASDESAGTSNSDRPVAYGPAGQPLYDAQWYREPTDAELGYYTKYARPGPGFGEIACQTVARFHVDNCVEIGETPGSGYARAIREAAWQFLVLPPRIGGKMMVGTWVRIHIDYTERKER